MHKGQIGRNYWKVFWLCRFAKSRSITGAVFSTGKNRTVSFRIFSCRIGRNSSGRWSQDFANKVRLVLREWVGRRKCYFVWRGWNWLLTCWWLTRWEGKVIQPRWLYVSPLKFARTFFVHRIISAFNSFFFFFGRKNLLRSHSFVHVLATFGKFGVNTRNRFAVTIFLFRSDAPRAANWFRALLKVKIFYCTP